MSSNETSEITPKSHVQFNRGYTPVMEVRDLGDGVHVFLGPVNLGAIVVEGKALFVDAGLDDGPARKLYRWAEENHLSPHAAVLTHAHADHFGGAFLWANRGLSLYASPLEGAMMEHPILEPIFLFAGATPPQELRAKFTLAKPCRIQPIEPGPLELGPFTVEVISLPGHAPAQIGVRFNHVLFCADALFPEEVLRKHPIPFCHDFDGALESLKVVEGAENLVPGHGPLLSGDGVRRACNAFRDQLQKIRDIVHRELHLPRTGEELVVRVAEKLGANFFGLADFCLAQTTIHAVLTSLSREGLAQAVVEGNRLLWRRR